MKKISLIISLIFTSVTGILTSCSEDYPGPDPVDVTANYSNKFSNPKIGRASCRERVLRLV